MEEESRKEVEKRTLPAQVIAANAAAQAAASQESVQVSTPATPMSDTFSDISLNTSAMGAFKPPHSGIGCYT